MATTLASNTSPISLSSNNLVLSQLVESSKNLVDPTLSLGTIQYSIGELVRQTKLLEQSLPRDISETKAHYLLAGSGVNAERIGNEIDSINLHPIYEAGPTAYGTAVDEYLRYRKEENVIALIEDSIRQAALDFDAFVAQTVTIDWQQQKQAVYAHFGLIPKQQQEQQPATPAAKGSRGGRKASDFSPSFASALQSPRMGLAGQSRKWAGWKQTTLGQSILGPPGSGDEGQITNTSEFADVEFSQLPSTLNGVAASLAIQNRRTRYAQVISNMNQARLIQRGFPIISNLSQVVQALGTDARSQQLHDSWKILARIVDEDTSQPPLERKYANVYAQVDSSTPQAIHLRRQFVNGSLSHLEWQFFSHIQSEITRYPQEAQLGGVPSALNKVRAYLNLRFLRNGQWAYPNLEIVNNVPIWALLFYLIRCGCLQEALDYTLKNESSFQKIERAFPTYLKAFVNSPDRRLSYELNERLRTEFNQHIRFQDESSDPFKYALYKIIGRCELFRKTMPQVLPTTEDWLWAHLMLTREEGDLTDQPLYDRYTLEDVQNMIIHFGARHFNPRGTNAGLYFQVLLLSGQFERAVHYLYSFQPDDAVHFAIGLSYYGLLRVSSADELNTGINTNNSSSNSGSDNTNARTGYDLLTLNSQQQPEISFARLIGFYTRDFRRSDSEIAIDYLVLICLGGVDDAQTGQLRHSQQLELCHEAIRELLLETREYALLLGDVRADGTREGGVIERKMPLIQLDDERDYLQTITEQAAIRADQEGRMADAVLLYHLSEEYDVVVSVINKTLGEALGTGRVDNTLAPNSPLSLTASQDPVQLAHNMLDVYSKNPSIFRQVMPRNREACQTLLGMAEAYRLYGKFEWENCLRQVGKVGIIPIDLRSDVGIVRRRAQEFSSLHESVVRNVPGMLILIMECAAKISQQLNESSFGDASRAKKIGELRIHARNCMVYAGMIQYRMSREIFSRLTRLETLL